MKFSAPMAFKFFWLLLASWLAGQLGGKLLTPLLMVPGNLTDEQLQQLV